MADAPDASRAPEPAVGPWSRLMSALYAPVDGAALVWFRVVFGAIMVWEASRYLAYGWVAEHYVDPVFHFKYFGWDWVPHPPGAWMYVLVVGWALAALGIALGAFYRASTIAFAVLFPWFFLLEQAKYLNHLYLVCLLGLICLILPANRLLSVDAWRRPALRSDHVPAWSLWLLRFQLGVVYFYAGVAKINGDWLQGEPMRMWMDKRVDYPLFGALVASEPATWLLSYSGMFFDLLIPFVLLWKRTRYLGLAAVAFFHVSNEYLFSIGIFPYLMLCATLLFLEPGWPRRAFPVLFQRPMDAAPPTLAPPAGRRALLLGVLVLWGAYQLLMPLRHHLYPGNVAWTEEGHKYAWRMKLRSKGGKARFHLLDKQTGETWIVMPREHLTERQRRKMPVRPDMVHQYAHFLRDQARLDGHQDVAVHAEVYAGLNGRPQQPLVDPTVDLAATPRTLGPRDYITSLQEPLPTGRWSWAIAMELPRADGTTRVPRGGPTLGDDDGE